MDWLDLLLLTKHTHMLTHIHTQNINFPKPKAEKFML